MIRWCRDGLFTFLNRDGIPWENNMAERALRQLAVQRRISGSFYKRSADHYLLLLAISLPEAQQISQRLVIQTKAEDQLATAAATEDSR